MTIDEFLNLVATDLTIRRKAGEGRSFIETAIADLVDLDEDWHLMDTMFLSRNYILGKIKEMLCLNQDR